MDITNYYISLPSAHLKHSYRVGLVIPIYNRFQYVRRCFASLQASQLQDTIIILVDDASDDPAVIELIDNFVYKDNPIILIRRIGGGSSSAYNTLPKNLNVAFNYLDCYFSCYYFCILDSDTIVKPNWLEKTCQVHEYYMENNTTPVIVSGFNTLRHKMLKEKSTQFVRKASIGGINMLFKPTLYQEVFLPLYADWDEFVVRRMRERNYTMLCTKPSVVQHIGYQGSFSRGRLLTNRAFDYGSPIRAHLSKWCYHLIHILWRKIVKPNYQLIMRLRKQLFFNDTDS